MHWSGSELIDPLGNLLSEDLDPPERAEARSWYTKAAYAGHTWAQHNLGVPLADVLDPAIRQRATPAAV